MSKCRKYITPMKGWNHSTLKNVSERAAVFEMAHPTQDHRSKCPACDRGERVITPPATRILGPGAQELEKLRNAKSK